VVQHTPRDLFAKLVVRGYGIAELLADFYVRQPTWLWTSRHYLEGVVNLNEQPTVTDAVLEYVIEGVMVDVKSFFIKNELPYEWENITTVPKLIKRATTYGAVASLFARGYFSHRLTVSIPPRMVTVIADGGHERTMDYWEGRMEEMLEFYSSSVALEIFWVSTDDEEPVFSMEDIPMETGDPYKYDVPG